MLCLTAGSAATWWFLFSPFSSSHTRAAKDVAFPPWLLLPAWCFRWQAGCWNAAFRERQMEAESRALEHCFSLWLSLLLLLPQALHSNISWAPLAPRPERHTTSGIRQTEKKKSVLVPKILPSVTLGKWSSPWFTWQIRGNRVRGFLENLFCFHSCAF